MTANGDDEAETELPAFRTWNAVYALVVGAFCVWVLGLLALAAHFA